MQKKKAIWDDLEISSLTLNCYHQGIQNNAEKARNRWNIGWVQDYHAHNSSRKVM